MIVIHQDEQFDIISGGIKNPLCVVGWSRPGSYSRLLCLWRGGLWVSLLGKRRICVRWSSKNG